MFSKGHPDYYQDLAEAIARRTPGAFFVNQFAKSGQSAGARRTTGPEILRQMDRKVDAIVVGVGSGGTLTGVGRFMRQASPSTAMILADPEGSVLAPFVETGRMTAVGSWAVEGIGEDFVPPNADLHARVQGLRDPRRGKLCHRARAPARGGRARRFFLGHAAGGCAALLPRADGAEARHQPGLRLRRQILSKVFNPAFLAQEGWTVCPADGTVRDIVISRYSEGATLDAVQGMPGTPA